jgi:3-hydroxyacyl-CoA dehydrogenase/enoyl-CoA hydratase/3-hydroxybutyryl-CoA epimerase
VTPPRFTVTPASDPGVALVTIDVPGQPVNTFGSAAIGELEALLGPLADDATVVGLVLISGKPDSFIAGADIAEFARVTTADEGEAVSQAAHRCLDRVARYPKPIVAAIHGPCLGLGLELALACTWRVASDDPKTQLGLPEVQLGVIPGAGGCNRLPRAIGLRAALDIILAGKSERAAKALRLGLIDELVPHSILQRTAVQAARRIASEGKPRRRPGGGRGLGGAALDRNPLGRRIVYRSAAAQVRKRTGGHYPAPLRALEVVRAGLERGLEAGLAAEARAFGELAVSPVSRELVRIFFATTALKKDDGAGAGGRPREVTRLGVIGAGFMGAAIAGTAAASAGVEVRLKDADLPRVGRGIKAAVDLLRGRLARKRISRFEYERLAALVSGGVDEQGFDRAELVIEAVFEDLEVKRQVLARLEEVITPDAVFASNTSTIPITRIAQGARRPERVLGMHFFSPVDRMPLLEVIPGERTGAEAIVTAVRFGRRMGKTVIVVADRPGFWVNRILSPYLGEAGRLLMEGVPIEVLDRVMLRFGFPVGPATLLDEVGLDVAAKAAAVMHEAFGERMAPAPAIARLLESGRLGRKAGKGFFSYDRGKKGEPDPRVYDLLGVKPLAAVDEEEVERRLLYPLLNEAAAALAEGVVRQARDGDIGAVFGIGFPPFRGGPLRLIDALGAPAVAAGLEELARSHGPRFAPAAALAERAASGARYYAEDGPA